MTCDDVTHCDDGAPVLQSTAVPQSEVELVAERNRQIIALFREGNTSNKIAKILGVSRNVVVGIRHRYNAKNPYNRIGNMRKVKPKKDVYKPDKIVKWRGKPKIKLPDKFDQNGYVPSTSKRIYQLRDGECKFAVSPHGVPPEKHRFCGQPALENNSYCDHHHRLCRETSSDRKAKSQANSTRGKVRLPAWFSYHY